MNNLRSYVEQRRLAARLAAQSLRTVDFVDLTSAGNAPGRLNSDTCCGSTRRSNNYCPNERARIHHQSTPRSSATSTRYSPPTDSRRDQRAEININLDSLSNGVITNVKIASHRVVSCSDSVRTSVNIASYGDSGRDISISVHRNDSRDSTLRDPLNRRSRYDDCRVLNEVPIVIDGSPEGTNGTSKRRSEHLSTEEEHNTSSKSPSEPVRKRARPNNDKEGRELDCPICFVNLLDSNVKVMVTPCGHMFCLECLKTSSNKSNNAVMRCSICRKQILFRSCTLVHL
ncbi:hypothetical protein QAD02_010818 [Eretmocerus hayati]|uniref:Uncharacterized protein n=1 Tax=Eretmocerus hayati TaxID=131215 RepID=A0ACC2NVD2_9HYME|nr:hypothetical protein QAD02_010818 [Eretmocerus hayati]